MHNRTSMTWGMEKIQDGFSPLVKLLKDADFRPGLVVSLNTHERLAKVHYILEQGLFVETIFFCTTLCMGNCNLSCVISLNSGFQFFPVFNFFRLSILSGFQFFPVVNSFRLSIFFIQGNYDVKGKPRPPEHIVKILSTLFRRYPDMVAVLNPIHFEVLLCSRKFLTHAKWNEHFSQKSSNFHLHSTIFRVFVV